MFPLKMSAEVVQNYDFTNQTGLSEWKQTKTLDYELAPHGVVLRASGWDAKLYQQVSFSPGHYVLSVRGKGDLKVLVLRDWNSPPLAVLGLSGKSIYTDYQDFEIPAESSGTYILALWLPGQSGTGQVESIRVDSASGVPATMYPIPTPAELARYRPDPPVVRGFMTTPLGGVTPETLEEIHRWGASVIRLQINPVALATKIGKPLWEAWPTILDELDQTVASAGANGLKVIVDLHFPPIPEIVKDRKFDQADLWKHPDLEKNFVRVWTDIARKLKPRSKVIWGYDLYNEPLDRSQLPWAPKEWYPLAIKLLKAIRAVDPDVWIIYEPGPGGMSRGYEGLMPLPDTRVIYSVHEYSPGEFTHQGISDVQGFDNTDIARNKGVPYPTLVKGVLYDKTSRLKALEPAIRFQRKWDVPMYVGEFSVVRWAPKEDAVKWLQESVDLFESLGWSWTYHAFREYHGWSLEHDETYPADIRAPAAPASYETERAKVIKKAFQKNAVDNL